MRVLPPLRMPSFRRHRRKSRPAGPRVPSAARVLVLEVLVGGSLVVFLLTGSRGAFLDRLHPRADALVVVLLAWIVAGSHFLFVRRILPALRRRAAPAAYDQQSIML